MTGQGQSQAGRDVMDRLVISTGNLMILLYCLHDSLAEATRRSRQCCSGSKENRLDSHVLQNTWL